MLDVSNSVFLSGANVFFGMMFALVELISFIDSYHTRTLMAYYILVVILLFMVLMMVFVVVMLIMVLMMVMLLFMVLVFVVVFMFIVYDHWLMFLPLMIFMTFITVRRGAGTRATRVLIIIAF